jgi:predicted house-cleaning noncanonical NTP pyrophosphatase (MazG superfamily)
MPSDTPHSRKLVRDFVPAQAAQQNVHLNFDVAPSEQLEPLLRDKLVEEATELVAATGDREALIRLASIYELISALAAHHGADVERLADLAFNRHQIKGGFTKGYVLREDA